MKWEYLHCRYQHGMAGFELPWEGRHWHHAEPLENILNGLGAEGWELVSVVAISLSDGGVSWVDYFFKRTK